MSYRSFWDCHKCNHTEEYRKGEVFRYWPIRKKCPECGCEMTLLSEVKVEDKNEPTP